MVSGPWRWRPLPPLLVPAAGLVVAVAAFWFLARPLAEVQRHQGQFTELQRQIASAQNTRSARAAARGRILRLRAQARATTSEQHAALDAEAAALEAQVGWGDRTAVRQAVLASPLVRLTRSRDSSVRQRRESDGCLACHVSIAQPGFEKYPAPFRTHSTLASYVGAASPHPPSRVTCVACHMGDGHAATFASARHTTLPGRTRTDGAQEHAWTDAAAEGAMLPVGRVEAGCVTCHVGELYQPGAPLLNDAMITLQRGGCYACHNLAGMSRTPRRGPDLRRVGAKLTPDWVRAWLANPRAIKPATWMPRFWTADAASPDDAAAIDAVTAYLFSNSAPYAPAAVNPPAGRPERGKAIVDSVGCLGCHVVGDTPRDDAGVRRTFGQPLEGIGSKTTEVWLVDWLLEPARYSPGTRMPNLRLSAEEASDVAAYLVTLTAGRPPAPIPVQADDERYRSVIRRYAAGASATSASPDAVTGDVLRVLAGRAVIESLGCFNCHEIRGFEDREIAVPMAARPVWVDTEAQALHSRAEAPADGGRMIRLPQFDLGPSESARVALALSAVATSSRQPHGISMPWHVTKVTGRTLMQERNCVGCHQIEDLGGDFVKLVSEPTLGPPLLTPEGSRVQRQWLQRFLHQPQTIRPWLAVRMPTFGLADTELAKVSDYLAAIAPPNPKPSPVSDAVTAAAGKELFELLKCQQCHVLGTVPRDQPTANLAPDLRLARERLQADWILGWLRNPADILPGTRMPTFWPEYPKSFYPALSGDAAAQVRALREHVLALR
jgi:cbb3-type cytochrome oxidase cytochrome c subunit